MNISLGNNWYLGKDQYNWLVIKAIPVEKGVNAGSMRMATMGYYPNIELACKACVEKNLDGVLINSMQELKDEIVKSTERICDAIREAKGKLAGQSL